VLRLTLTFERYEPRSLMFKVVSDHWLGSIAFSAFPGRTVVDDFSASSSEIDTGICRPLPA
jgi:hypothetical protein